MRKKKRIMVCVTQQKSCERLIKRGAELSDAKHGDLYVVHVVKENWKYFICLHLIFYLFHFFLYNFHSLNINQLRTFPIIEPENIAYID